MLWFLCIAKDINGTTTIQYMVSVVDHIKLVAADRNLDGVPLLQTLQLPYVVSEGYANVRCVWTFGCPSELKLDVNQHNERDRAFKTTQAYPKAFQELFPGEQAPLTVGVGCCSQFAVTREKIHEKPLEDY
jgi:hypothetical protein